MKINKIRKHLLDKYEFIEEVQIIDILNLDTLETSAASVNCQLSNKLAYDIVILAKIRHEIGANSCAVFVEKGHVYARYRIYKPQQ